MKKAICLFFVVLLFCSFSTAVFARNEGLVNEAERSVIASVGEVLSRVNGAPFSVADRKVFENYFKTRDLTAEDAGKTNEYLEKGIEYFDGLDVKSISDLSKKEKVYFLNHLDKAGDVLGLTLTFTVDGKVQVRDAVTSELVYEQDQTIKATGQSPVYIMLGIIIFSCVTAVTIRLRKVSKNND